MSMNNFVSCSQLSKCAAWEKSVCISEKGTLSSSRLISSGVNERRCISQRNKLICRAILPPSQRLRLVDCKYCWLHQVHRKIRWIISTSQFERCQTLFFCRSVFWRRVRLLLKCAESIPEGKSQGVNVCKEKKKKLRIARFHRWFVETHRMNDRSSGHWTLGRTD